MRAKEYLEINKKKIYHYDLVKKAVYDLYPLRNSKRQTEAYFNRYLFADARYRSHTLNHIGKPPSTIFNERENEIDRTIVKWNDNEYEIQHQYTGSSGWRSTSVQVEQWNKIEPVNE